MHRRVWAFFAATAVALHPAQASGQDRSALSDEVRSYLSVSAPVVALENVLLFDGTGGPAQAGRTILIRGNRIEAVGESGSVDIPADAERLDLAGHSVMPGMVGLHNHLYYYQNTPRVAQMQYSGPAPLPGGRRHDRADHRQHVALPGHLAQGARSSGARCPARASSSRRPMSSALGRTSGSGTWACT